MECVFSSPGACRCPTAFATRTPQLRQRHSATRREDNRMIASFRGWMKIAAAVAALLMVLAGPVAAQQPEPAERGPGGEASLVLPALDSVDVGGYNGRTLLMIGLGVSLGGMIFGLLIMARLKALPVHRS